MYLKTNKPILTDNNTENFQKMLNYIENMKEEIAFNIDTLSKKVEYLRKSANKSTGGEA